MSQRECTMIETKETHAVRSGALHSSLTIELHTHYAISLWNGRRDESSKKNKPVIISMPRFFSLAGRISQDSLIDNPYADMAMLALETKLASAHGQMQAALAELAATLSGVPAQIHLSEIASVAPLNIGVYSRTPLGYRCVWLLVGYDQLVMKALQAHHYALISRQQCDGFLKKGGYWVRQIYGAVQPYRSFAVTRDDILSQTPVGREAITRLGLPDEAVMRGEKRSVFSPALKSTVKQK
ncbi:PFL_4669 family integrating conjugative element protein [Photorhabdus laumondii]|uniref:PFL_4669 family integrating conjugative element protein n=1 Tax=Photorhabdus laumondii TaxID=2218628 RepID=UPI0025AF340D|nr:TIGR03761 family integrating conjugative element protein [Photorhabdus laumondii]